MPRVTLEHSSHAYREWLEPLARGVSPHDNPVTVREVDPGYFAFVLEGVKTYFAGNVRPATKPPPATSSRSFTLTAGRSSRLAA